MIPPSIAEWGWQDEVAPDTGRKHRQGYFRTFRQMRFSQITKILPGIHIEVARNWQALLNYCKKKETRDENGTVVNVVNANKPMTMGDALTALAKHANVNINKPITDPATGLISYAGDKEYKAEYWMCVREYLTETDNANGIGLFTNNQMVSAWVNTRMYWIGRYNSENKIPAASIADAASYEENEEH